MTLAYKIWFKLHDMMISVAYKYYQFLQLPFMTTSQMIAKQKSQDRLLLQH